ncbi:MAG: hypothetical protein KGI37_07165 [Alphaproteobacteria bacterium]|nr:hypothetical protein [Alphaproteobacteria bacterium]
MICIDNGAPGASVRKTDDFFAEADFYRENMLFDTRHPDFRRGGGGKNWRFRAPDGELRVVQDELFRTSFEPHPQRDGGYRSTLCGYARETTEAVQIDGVDYPAGWVLLLAGNGEIHGYDKRVFDKDFIQEPPPSPTHRLTQFPRVRTASPTP